MVTGTEIKQQKDLDNKKIRKHFLWTLDATALQEETTTQFGDETTERNPFRHITIWTCHVSPLENVYHSRRAFHWAKR